MAFRTYCPSPFGPTAHGLLRVHRFARRSSTVDERRKSHRGRRPVVGGVATAENFDSYLLNVMMSLKRYLQEKMPPPPGFYTFRGTDDGWTMDGPGGGYRSPGPPPLLPPSAIRTANFSAEFFFGRKIFQPNVASSTVDAVVFVFLKCCSGEVGGGEAPPGISVTRGLPPGSRGAEPPQESPLPVPCPRRSTYGRKKSKNEPQASYRTKNSTI